MDYHTDTYFDNTRHPADSNYDRVYDFVDVPIANLPVTIRLGSAAVRYHIVGPSEAKAIDTMFNTDDIDVFVVSTEYQPGDDIGYKAVRNHETVELGRQGSPRFPITETTVSRKAAVIRREDGVVHIEDPASLNGLYIARETRDTPIPHTLDNTLTPPKGIDFTLNNELVRDGGYYSEGDPRKTSNEDAQFIEGSSLGVFDGVGSSKQATLASNFVANDVRRQLQALPSQMTPAIAEKRMRAIITNTTKTLHDICEQQRIDDAATTATFATAYKNNSGETIATIASVGDSRAYLLRKGCLEQLTVDDATSVHQYGTARDVETAQNEQHQAILNTARSYEDIHKAAQELARSEHQTNDTELALIKKHKSRNVIKYALASYFARAHYSVEHVAIEDGDMLILTTDGIHDPLTTQRIKAIVESASSAAIAAQHLVQAARCNEQEAADPTAYSFRGKSDDRTAVVIQF